MSSQFIVVKIRQTSIEAGSLKWFYREVQPEAQGSAKPVILLHGLPSQSLSWTGLLPLLAAHGMQAIAPDWIGYGNSSKPEPRDFAYTPEAFVTALTELIDALDVEQFSLVIQGFLGTVGLQYAVRCPDRIDKLVILNAPLNPTAKLPWKLTQLGLPIAGEMLTQDPLAVERILEAGCKQVIPDEYLEVYRKPYLKSAVAGRALLATIRNLKLATSLTEIATGLPTLDLPIQIIWGTNDPWLDLSGAEAWIQSLKQGKLVTIPTAAHYPQEHCYAEIERSIVPFLVRS